MDPRVARFSQIVKNYEGTSEKARVGVKTQKDGKLNLAIGGRNPYDTAGRRVKQLKHVVSQFGISKHEKTSYEGEKLKRFVQEHGGKDLVQRLARQGVFRGTITYGKLQSIAQALEKEEKASSAELEKTMSHPLEKKNAENEPLPVIATSPQRPKAQAKQNWLNRNIKKERASSREKAFLNAQRGILYSDLTPEDQASLKALVHAKQASLEPDKVAVEQAQFDFKGSALQKLEQHNFPDLMRFANLAAVDKNIKYKTSELSQKAIRDKLADIDSLIKNLQAEHVDLEGKDKERMDDWIGSVKGLLKAWGETGYINLDARALGFVDEFCKQAYSSFNTYHALVLKANNIDLAYTELDALEEEPMERLLKDPALSPNAQGFLLQELARFSSQNPELKGLKQYEQFIQHLSGLEKNTGLTDSSAIDLFNQFEFDPIDMSQSPILFTDDAPPIEIFLAQEAAKQDSPAPNASGTISSEVQADNQQELRAEEPTSKQPWKKSLTPLSQETAQFIKNILQNAAHKAQFQSSLREYANKRNQAIEPIFTKILQRVVVPDIKKDANYHDWLRHEILPRVVDQTLSSPELRNISLAIADHESRKGLQFEGLKTFKGQDEDLKTLLEGAITALQPNLQRKEAVTQALLDQWYQFRESSKAERYVDEKQITGFLDHLAEFYKTDISILENKRD